MESIGGMTLVDCQLEEPTEADQTSLPTEPMSLVKPMESEAPTESMGFTSAEKQTEPERSTVQEKLVTKKTAMGRALESGKLPLSYVAALRQSQARGRRSSRDLFDQVS